MESAFVALLYNDLNQVFVETELIVHSGYRDRLNTLPRK